MKFPIKLFCFLFSVFLAVYFSQASLAFTKNRGQELVATYRQTPSATASTAEEYFFRALVKQMLGLNQEALQDYDQVVKLEPKDQDTYANRCGLLADLGQYKNAVSDCKQAIELGRDRAQAVYFNLGIAQQGLGDLKAAIASFKVASEHAKSTGDTNLVQQAEQRIELSQRVLKGQLSSEALKNYWQASDQASKGELQVAQKLYDAALASSPNFADAYLEKANLFALEKKYPEALNNYKKAESLNSDLIPIYNNRAAILIEYQKDYDGALKDLKTASQKASQQGYSEVSAFLNQSIEKVKQLKDAQRKTK